MKRKVGFTWPLPPSHPPPLSHHAAIAMPLIPCVPTATVFMWPTANTLTWPIAGHITTFFNFLNNRHQFITKISMVKFKDRSSTIFLWLFIIVLSSYISDNLVTNCHQNKLNTKASVTKNFGDKHLSVVKLKSFVIEQKAFFASVFPLH